jgi:hypothetical protein
VAPDELYAFGPDRFACRREPWRIVFERDAAGAVDAVRIEFLRRTVRGTRTLSPRYIGSAACIDCHEDGVHSIQYVAWLRSRHAHAYWRLGADWSLYLARRRPHYHDLKRPLADHRCLLCHVTGAQDDRALFSGSYRAEEGVGCESCHGPGSEYATPEIMSDHAAYIEHGGRIPDASTCRRCHRREGFDWPKMWAACSHPLADPDAARADSH